MNCRKIYKKQKAVLNGQHIESLSKCEIVTMFNIEQCLCSCSIQLDVHNPDCPNYKKENGL